MSESDWETVTVLRKKKTSASARPKEAVTAAESDWDTVVLRKKQTAGAARSKEAVTAAQRRGQEIETTMKWTAGQNKQHATARTTAAILDCETEELRHTKVPLEVGKVIQRGRQEKGLSQKDLSTRINERAQVIAEYESGKAIPNNQVMGKIERVLGLKLRGKDIGQPLDPIKSKK